MKSLIGHVDWWRVLGVFLVFGTFAATCLMIYKFLQLVGRVAEVIL